MILSCPKCGSSDLEDTSVWCCQCKQWVEPGLEKDIQMARTVQRYTKREVINLLMAGWKGSLEDFSAAMETLEVDWRDHIKHPDCPHCGGTGMEPTHTVYLDQHPPECTWCGGRGFLLNGKRDDSEVVWIKEK